MPRYPINKVSLEEEEERERKKERDRKTDRDREREMQKRSKNLDVKCINFVQRFVTVWIYRLFFIKNQQPVKPSLIIAFNHLLLSFDTIHF